MLIAGGMWAEHQEKNQTEVTLFSGISKVVNQFSHISHGICSQNSQGNIRNVLSCNGIEAPFKSIVGYDDVSDGQQKPHPYGGIKCLETIFGHTENKRVIYIGDHEADTKFARNLQQELGGNTEVISIAAAYSQSTPENWTIKPDYIAYKVEDLLSIIGQFA